MDKTHLKEAPLGPGAAGFTFLRSSTSVLSTDGEEPFARCYRSPFAPLAGGRPCISPCRSPARTIRKTRSVQGPQPRSRRNGRDSNELVLTNVLVFTK